MRFNGLIFGAQFLGILVVAGCMAALIASEVEGKPGPSIHWDSHKPLPTDKIQLLGDTPDICVSRSESSRPCVECDCLDCASKRPALSLEDVDRPSHPLPQTRGADFGRREINVIIEVVPDRPEFDIKDGGVVSRCRFKFREKEVHRVLRLNC